MRWLRYSSVIAAAPLAAALVAAACAGEPPVEEPDPTEVPTAERFGGTAVVAGLGEIQTMNAFFSRDYLTDQFQA